MADETGDEDAMEVRTFVQIIITQCDKDLKSG